ncbi:response regulator [Bacillus cereus]|nr:response regulator [Bacillus cereus]
MRVLIADDEGLIRTSLRSMLEELDFPIEFGGEAANGEEMIEKLKETEPDIIFVDIRMPKLTGLEAIKIGKTISPWTQWIILTGFSEFIYAQEAIQLGAANYLLKPVSLEELEKALQQLFEQYQKHLIRLNKGFENDMVALYHGLSSVNEIDNEGMISNSGLKSAVFYVDSHLEEKAKAEHLRKFRYSLQETVSHFLSPGVRIALFTLPNGELITVVCWGCTKGSREESKSNIRQYFKIITDTLTRFCNADLSITMIESEECSSFDSLYYQINKVQANSPLRTVLGSGRKWDLAELNIDRIDSKTNELSAFLIKLSKYYKERLYLEFMKTLSALEKQLPRMDLTVAIKKNIQHFLLASTGCHLNVNEDITSWMKQLQTHSDNLLARNQKDENRQQDIIDQVITFIEQQYINDIGIGQIAEKFGVTPNYLSTLFRKKTGITFMKYLTQTRMLKAKELLVEPHIQVQQVAEKVGYYSTRHFTKLFTEFAGCYPSEYRKQFIK